MKKVGKILLVVWAVLATFLLVMACIAYNENDAEWVAKYDELLEEYDDLKELLPYKLVYNALTSSETIDWETALADVAEEYDLSDVERLSLAHKVEQLFTLLDIAIE